MRYIVYDRFGHEICRDMMPIHRRPMKYRVLFLFNQDDMLYEIQNLAMAQGEAAGASRNGEASANGATNEGLEQFKNICDETNIDRVLRTIPLAISKCEKMLHTWAKYKIMEHASIDNAIQDKKEFVMELQVEEHFTGDIAWALIRNIQEYIEEFVLFDWAGITYPEAKAHWADMLAATTEEIKDLTSYMEDDCMAIIPPVW